MQKVTICGCLSAKFCEFSARCATAHDDYLFCESVYKWNFEQF